MAGEWRTKINVIRHEAGWDESSMMTLLLNFIFEQPDQLVEALVRMLQQKQLEEREIREQIVKLNHALNKLKAKLN